MARSRSPGPEAKRHAGRVVDELERLYPAAHCALVHRNPFELLVATILSAQCTDARVNLVTPALFARFPDAPDLALGDPGELESFIHSAGFFRAKARNLKAMALALVERHGGEVPADLDALTALPGVGRKTANVVMGNVFGVASGVVVDTHVTRLARRLGLTKQIDPKKIENDLIRLVPSEQWVDLSHRLIDHGRAICVARKPRCGVCPLAGICPQVGVT